LGTITDASGQQFGQIEAYGAIFNNVDEGNDRIVPGAFKRTLRSAKDRATARQNRYLAPMLWQHDTHELIGGWYEIEEDGLGLKAKGDINLSTQRGQEYYALAKAHMTDQFSIIYDIPSGGAKFDKGGVRDLAELRLFSIDPVTFAMNDATFLVNVKAASEGATVCGNTKGPIGPRDEAWDGGKAEGEIWAAAYDDASGAVDKAKAKKYFMVCAGDGTKKGDYSYPFWYVGSDPHICVGAVKAIAAAVQGARGASAPDGLKPKVESLYRRISSKYPDDPQLTPPWKDGEKARQPMQRKTFAERYTEQQCRDLLRDWQDVVLTAFTGAVYDAFQIGDEPESDINDALDALKGAVSEWVEEAVKYGLSDYLDAQGSDYDGGTESRMQNGTSTGYGYYGMARSTPLQRKAMTAGDATTGGFTADHVDKLHGAAEDGANAVDKHTKALHDAAKSVKAMIKGTPQGDGAKAGRAFSAANEKALSDHADSLDAAADSHSKSMKRHLGAVSDVADDLATILQGSEAAYGADAGTPAKGEQEGKTRAPSQGKATETRAPHTPPSAEDTASEEDVARALAAIRKLRAV
jgi:hypothetical protein